MATYTRRMIRIVSDVWMRLSFLPALAGDFVAGAAFRLMFLRCVRELGIVDCRRTILRALWSPSTLAEGRAARKHRKAGHGRDRDRLD